MVLTVARCRSGLGSAIVSTKSKETNHPITFCELPRSADRTPYLLEHTPEHFFVPMQYELETHNEFGILLIRSEETTVIGGMVIAAQQSKFSG